MAIISNYFNGRTDYTDQYMRVENVYTDKNSMIIQIGIHLTEEMAKSGVPPHAIEELRGEFDMFSSKNLWEQAYDVIKRKWLNHTDA